jgi:putative component of membrane protein insertase Oxa1/YidC/SpoIIIJ protein YidD
MIKHAIIFFMTGLRPLLGPAACRFPLSCTHFAVEQLKKKSLVAALWAIIKRIAACQPFL